MERLVERLKRFRDDRDWAQFHTPKDLAISVSVEAAELLELFQWQKSDAIPDAELVKAVRGEAADIYLYLLLLCDKLGIDLLEAGHAKVTRNEERFPVRQSHGIAKPNEQGSL